MRMQHLLRPIEVENLVADQCPVKPHRHSFFELVYILDGKGVCIIDDCEYPYSKNDLFVIVPDYGHHTEVHSTTSFLFIRFNSGFVESHSTALGDRAETWLEKIEYIFRNQHKLQEQSDVEFRSFLRLLCKSMLPESDDDMLHQLVRTMLMVIVKRIQQRNSLVSSVERSPAREIVEYIHRHIRYPAHLRLESIAAHVNMSRHYVSEYFRKHCSMSLQQYINDYRIKLVEDRLRRSNMRLGEIADEFGFASESHLIRSFRKKNGVSPVRFRKAANARV